MKDSSRKDYELSMESGRFARTEEAEGRNWLVKITYVGHSTLILETGRHAILVDPFWAERILWQKRRVPPALPLEEIPEIDAVLITHTHPDHFDVDALERLRKGIPAVMPKGGGKKAERMGFKVRELSPWESSEIGPFRITAVPAPHFGTCLGYVVRTNGVTLYVTGDSKLFPELERIGREFRVDLMAMPFGGSPFMGIIWDIDDAVEAVKTVHPRYVLPVHRETFSQWLFTPPKPMEFAGRLRAECPFSETLTIDEGDCVFVCP